MFSGRDLLVKLIAEAALRVVGVAGDQTARRDSAEVADIARNLFKWVTDGPVYQAGRCAGQKRPRFGLFQTRHDQVSLCVCPLLARQALHEGIEDTTPPTNETPVIENMLTGIADAAGKEILVLGAGKEVDDGLHIGALAMVEQVGEKGGADLADGRWRTLGQAEQMQVASRVGLGDEQDGLIGGSEDEDLDGEGEERKAWRRLLDVVGAGRCALQRNGRSVGMDRDGEKVTLAIRLVRSLAWWGWTQWLSSSRRRRDVVNAEPMALRQHRCEPVAQRSVVGTRLVDWRIRARRCG